MSLALLLGVFTLMAVTASHFYLRGTRPEPRGPQAPIDPKSDYQIESVVANKCVQLAPPSPEKVREAQIATCAKTAAQRFHFDLLPDGFYRIRLAGSNDCLEVADRSHDDGTAVDAVMWNGGFHQQWQAFPMDDGTVRLMARHSEKALDLWHGSADDGTPLKQVVYKASSNQHFRLKAADRADP